MTLKRTIAFLAVAGCSALRVGLAAPRPPRSPPPRLVASGLVSEYMSPALTLSMDMSLHEAMTVLSEKSITGAPVVELPSGRLVGVLSQFDFLSRAGTDVQKALEGDVASAMTVEGLVTVRPTDYVDEVSPTMIKRRFGHVPVVAASGELVGVLKSTDVMRHLLEKFPKPLFGNWE